MWGSQLNQGMTPPLALHAVESLDVHDFEGPARRRATCGILVNIMSINSCPAGPPSLAGSTAQLRINPASSCAQRRHSCMMHASMSNSLPRRLRVPFETRHESWSDGIGPASSATRMRGRSDHSAIRHHCLSSCRRNVLVYTRPRSNLAWSGVLGSQQRLLRDGMLVAPPGFLLRSRPTSCCGRMVPNVAPEFMKML